jgi:hypothetical protein
VTDYAAPTCGFDFVKKSVPLTQFIHRTCSYHTTHHPPVLWHSGPSSSYLQANQPVVNSSIVKRGRVCRSRNRGDGVHRRRRR